MPSLAFTIIIVVPDMIAIAVLALLWWPDPPPHFSFPLAFLFCSSTATTLYISTRVRANTPTFLLFMDPRSQWQRVKEMTYIVCRACVDAPLPWLLSMSIYAQHLKWPGHMDFPPLLLIIRRPLVILLSLSSTCLYTRAPTSIFLLC